MINDKYNSLDELYSSVLRGNEIEFQYEDKQYFILPNYDRGKITGVCFGEAYTENQKVCLSEADLYNVCIKNTNLGEVVAKIVITWDNFK